MTEHSGASMNTGDNGTRGISPWRIAGWSVAALILLVPLVAMQFTSEVLWTASDFVFAAILVLAVGIPLELVVRKSSNPAYRAGAVLALGAAFMMTWANAAVGITDTEADTLYLIVIAVGIVGTLLARARAGGMALAMVAAALTLVAVSAFALATGAVADHNSPLKIAGITSFFAVLFVGSAMLFRQAAHEPSERAS